MVRSMNLLNLGGGELPRMKKFPRGSMAEFQLKGTSKVVEVELENGLIAGLLKHMVQTEFPDVQPYACGAIAGIIHEGDAEMSEVLRLGGIDAYIKVLGSPNVKAAREAVIMISHLAYCGQRSRLEILRKQHVIPQLVKLLAHEECVIEVAECLSHLVKEYAGEKLDPTLAVLPVFVRLLALVQGQALTLVFWGLFRICSWGPKHTQLVREAKALEPLVSLMDNPESSVSEYSVDMLSQIWPTDSLQFSHRFISAGGVSKLVVVLHRYSDERFRVKTCSLLTKIASAGASQIQVLIDAFVFKTLIQLLAHGPMTVKIQAVCALSFGLSGTIHQLRFIVELGLIDPLCKHFREIYDFLKTGRSEEYIASLKTTVSALAMIIAADSIFDLRGGFPTNFRAALVEAGVLERIAGLMAHRDRQLAELASVFVSENIKIEYPQLRKSQINFSVRD